MTHSNPKTNKSPAPSEQADWWNGSIKPFLTHYSPSVIIGLTCTTAEVWDEKNPVNPLFFTSAALCYSVAAYSLQRLGQYVYEQVQEEPEQNSTADDHDDTEENSTTNDYDDNFGEGSSTGVTKKDKERQQLRECEEERKASEARNVRRNKYNYWDK